MKRTSQLKKNTASRLLRSYRYDSHNWPVIFDFSGVEIGSVNPSAFERSRFAADAAREHSPKFLPHYNNGGTIDAVMSEGSLLRNLSLALDIEPLLIQSVNLLSP